MFRTLSFVLALSTFSRASNAKNVLFVAQDSPPFYYSEGGKAVGAAPDIMKTACAKLKWDCKMEILPLKRATTMLETGEAQGFLGMIHLPERESFLNFSSAPAFTARIGYMGIKGVTPEVKNDDGMKGFTVHGVRASAAFKKAQELKDRIKDLNLVEFNNYPDGFGTLFRGSLGPKDVVVSPAEIGYHLAKQQKLDKLVMVHLAERVPYKAAFSKKADSKLTEEFDKVLTEM